MNRDNRSEVAVFGGGCFWCTEAVFQRLKGVIKVTPGYTGGNTEDPSYESVSMGNTNHAEVIQIKFDPSVISFLSLLKIFFATHDPTTLNRQGNDIGAQYRSAVFYSNETQKNQTLDYIKELKNSKKIKEEIVTEISGLDIFYEAEDYHRDYYNKNRIINSYCRIIIDPKIRKLVENYSDKINSDSL